MGEPRIYLDNAATTRPLSQVAQAMAPWRSERFGNPSSLYLEGREARRAIDEARENVSRVAGCEFGEVIFTSSGTEAANLAIVGAALANSDTRRNKVLMSAAEHHCVLNTRPLLERLGYQVALLDVDCLGVPKLADVGSDVLLLAAMRANNETGAFTDALAWARRAKEVGALYFCDAVQSFPEESPSDADMVAISGHKINGPKGAGALIVGAGTKLKPLTLGGAQEREMRAGTEDVAAIVGFGVAVREWALNKSMFEAAKKAARDAFVQRLVELGVAGLRFTIDASESLERRGDFEAQSSHQILAGHCHLSIDGLDAESMLILLDRLGVSAASGAACSSGSIEPSHVLLAMGFSPQKAKEGLRFTFGIDSTPDEGRRAAEILAEAADRIRGNKSAKARP